MSIIKLLVVQYQNETYFIAKSNLFMRYIIYLNMNSNTVRAPRFSSDGYQKFHLASTIFCLVAIWLLKVKELDSNCYCFSSHGYSIFNLASKLLCGSHFVASWHQAPISGGMVLKLNLSFIRSFFLFIEKCLYIMQHPTKVFIVSWFYIKFVFPTGVSESLKKLLADPDLTVRQKATECLYVIGGEILLSQKIFNDYLIIGMDRVMVWVDTASSL